jgi:hypothetical protein
MEGNMPADATTNVDKLMGYRKLIVSGVILLVGVLVAFFKDDVPPNLMQLLQVVFGGFVVGNVGEHLVDASYAKSDAKVEVARLQAVAQAPEPWDDNFEALKALINQNSEEVKQLLLQAMNPPAGAVDYSTAIQSMMQSLEKIHETQQINQKALSMIISKGMIG